MLKKKSPAVAPLFAALTASSILGSPAWSQSLEEMTVTARKTEESLQDVPISITAFSADELLEIGAYNNDDVARMTVNFNTVSQIGRRLDRPVIRGMAAPSIFGEPNASYFVDGAYVSGTISAATLGPVQRVEILRGPQSAQFGRATFSGAVNYVTRRPTNDFTSEVLVRAGDNETRQVSAWASGPIVRDKLMYFGSLSWDKYGGEWNNNLQPNTATPGEPTFVNPPQQGDTRDLGGTDTRQAVGKLLWTINDSADLTFKLGYLKGDDKHYPQLIVETDELNCFVPGEDISRINPDTGELNLNYFTSAGQYCGVIDWENRENRLNLPDIEEGMTANLYQGGANPGYQSTGDKVGLQREQWNTLLEYSQDFNDWNMTARGAWNKDQLNTAYDLDGTEARPLLGLFNLYEDQLREDTSFELRFASPVENRFRGSFGVYYYDFEETAKQKSHVGLEQGNISRPTFSTTENVAAFGSIDYDLTEKLTFTAEVRYAEDTKAIQSPNVCDDPDSSYFDPDTPIRHEETTEAWTPRFTFNYAATDAAMVYMQVAKGNKPGAFNRAIYSDYRDGCQIQEFYNGSPDGSVPPIAFVDEENAWTWEVGTKTSWFNNRIIANLAVFYIDWKNLTAFETRNIIINGLPAPQSLGLNAGNAEVKGLELETTFAITDKLIATFGYGYNNGRYTEYASKSYADTTGIGLVQTGVLPNGNPRVEWDSSVNNLEGAQIPNSPKHNFVTSLAYNDQFTADLGWFARTDFAFDSKKYTSGTNFEQIGQRKSWNGRIGLDHNAWRLALYVNNILDEQTPSAIIGFPRLLERNNAGAPNARTGVPPNGYLLTPTPGRRAGVEAVFRFGN